MVMSRFPVRRGQPCPVSQHLDAQETGGVDRRHMAIPSTRLQASGRLSPCPVCGRNVDDKCRFSSELILCYQGERFHPPSDVRIGDVLWVEGRRWYLAATEAGYANASHCYGLHRELTPASQAQRERHQRVAGIAAELIPARFLEVRRRVHAVAGTLNFELSTLEEILRDQALARATAESIADLRLAIEQHRRRVQELNKFRVPLALWHKAVSFQLADIGNFLKHQLGTPLPSEIDHLEGVV